MPTPDNSQDVSPLSPQQSSPVGPQQNPAVDYPTGFSPINSPGNPTVNDTQQTTPLPQATQASPQVETLPTNSAGSLTQNNLNTSESINGQNTSAPQAPPVANGIHIFTSETAHENQAAAEASAKKANSGKIIKLALFILAFLTVFVATPFGVWAVAYEKVELTSAPDIQQKVSYVVMSLPFTPKTAKFILVKSALVGQRVTSNSFDVSAAINTSQTQDLFGLNKLDFAMVGAANYYDIDSLNAYFNISITKDFNLDYRSKGNNIYFRINKVPSFIFSVFGIKSDAINPLLNRWVHYDKAPLDTKARQMLDDKPAQTYSQKELLESVEKVFDKKLLTAIKVTSDKDDGLDVFKLTLNFTDELLNHLFKNLDKEMNKDNTQLYLQNQNTGKPSDNIKNMTVVIMIEKDTHYVRKLSADFDLVADSRLTNMQKDAKVLGLTTPSLFSPGDKATVALVATFSDYGKMVIVEVPDDAMSYKEFGDKLSEILIDYYGSMLTQTQSLNFDPHRLVDLTMISKSLDFYYIECEGYPETLDDLTRTGCNRSAYFTTIPNDPDGSVYYYKVTEDKQRFDLCANVDELYNTLGACPDPRYNYHITSN